MLLPSVLKEKGLFGRLAVLQLEAVATLTSDLSRLLDQADKHGGGALGEELGGGHAPSQLALDRLAQALQVALANGALLCSRGERRCSAPSLYQSPGVGEEQGGAEPWCRGGAGRSRALV